MKILKISVFALIAIFIFNNDVAAQYTRTVSYSSSSANSSIALLSAIKTKMAFEGYTLASDDYITISEGQIKTKDRIFYANREYVVIVLPTEDGVNDIDLYLSDNYGNVVKQDTDDKSLAMITYEPYSQRNLVLKVKNQDSYSSTYNYDAHLLIFYK